MRPLYTSWTPLLSILVVLAAIAAGVLTTRVAVVGSDPCRGFEPNNPHRMVISPTVQSPLEYGLASGMLLGSWPKGGFGQAQSCAAVDAGVGMTVRAFMLIRMNAAYAFAAGRGLGFGLDAWLLLWALSWVWRAARILRHGATALQPK